MSLIHRGTIVADRKHSRHRDCNFFEARLATLRIYIQRPRRYPYELFHEACLATQKRLPERVKVSKVRNTEEILLARDTSHSPPEKKSLALTRDDTTEVEPNNSLV